MMKFVKKYFQKISMNPIDGIDLGADYRYNKLHSLPGFHEFKI